MRSVFTKIAVRSIFTKIVAWSCGTLVLSLLAFFLLTDWMVRHSGPGMGTIPRLQIFELNELRSAYETGGPAATSRLLARLTGELGGSHYFVDSQGRDLVSGADRSQLLASVAREPGEPVRSMGGLMTGSVTADGRYWLITIIPPPFDIGKFFPFYGLILFAVGLLSWPLAIDIGRPLRALAGAVDRFGQGDLGTRIRLVRKDEIGNLALSFDRMADRIETLLLAERRLLQDVSHELRSPLARLSFAVELARTAPDRDAALDRVRREASRLAELVGTLLEVTRSEGDPAGRSHAVFSLDGLVREVVEDCGLEGEDRGCRIVLARADSVSVPGDRELMRRAIENVVRNAVYYSPAESAVEVALTSDSRHTRIMVRDSGPGIPEELLSRIFDPFFRVDGTRNTATGGMGLGLSIALRAVRLHNGEIRAKNANPGLMVEIDLPPEKAEVRMRRSAL
jgi:two-component system sensor histidine kinase CpxA